MNIKPINNYDKTMKVVLSKPVQKILRYADKNPAIFQSLTVFTMCSVLRPLTIMTTPAKTEASKQDRLYSAGKSVASGITDLLFSLALFIPTNKIIDKSTDRLYKNSYSIIYQNEKASKMYKNLLNRGLKIAVIPIIAFLNYRYVKNIAGVITNIFNGNKNNENK